MNIRQAVPLLVERLRQQKVILFVGAGVSQASGLPGWKKLFDRFCKELGCPEEENFPAVATSLIQEHIHNRKEIIEHIVQQIGAVNLELNPNHELIKRLPFNILITTNYDNLLEDLYGPSRLTRIYSDDAMAYFDPLSVKRQLIYLHGDINHPDHMVVSSIDYQDFAEKRPIMVERLKTLLQDYTFLFTGYSANDPNLHAVFDHFRLTYKENANRHFIVLEDPGIVKQNEFRTRFGIEPVLLKDKKELTSFLQALVEAYENPDQTPALAQVEAAGEPGETDKDTGFVDDFIKARGKKSPGAAVSPTLMPLDFQPLKPFNVPGADPHFTGREKELEVLQKALLYKQTVAVTGLFGMGGIGKTSLAKQVAHQLHKEGRFKDGICWHRLEAKELAVSLEEMADVFGAAWLKEIQPLDTRARYFQAVIQDRDLLFILDNAEYLENIPSLLDLLRNLPILITSRRHLAGLAGVMDLHRLDNHQSVQLFIKTWKQEDRDEEIEKITAELSPQELEALHSICTGLLGNLPLALTIAGSVLRYKKIGITAFQKLLEEKRLSLLQDPNNVYKTEAKDKNVRLSFDLSFDQLPAGGIEQSMFAVMGIFGGEDFSREALVAIFKEEKKEALDNGVELLEQLSMVQAKENQRLYLHPLLRQYALEKLPQFKGEAAYEAMASYYLELVRKNPKALHYEWKNALSFADWCLAHARETEGLFLIEKIDWFLDATGKWTFREEWIKKGIDISERIEDVSYLYDFTEKFQHFYLKQGRITEQREVISTLSDHFRRFKKLEDRIPWINFLLALSFLVFHEMEKSYYINLKNIKESLFYNRKEEIGAIYRNLGYICRLSGLLQRALQFYRTDLVIQEKYGLKTNKIRAVGDICDIYLDLGQWPKVLEWYKRYEAELAENPHKELEALLYERYFFFYLDTGETGKAQDYLNKYQEAIKDFGAVTSSANLIYYEGLLEKAGGHYQQAVSTFEKARQFYLDIRREDETGKCFLQVGICWVKLGNTRKAREYLQAAGDIFKKYRIEPLLRCLQEAYYALLEARSAYDEPAVRLITRAKNTYRNLGIENSRELPEIEAEIRQEIGDDRYNDLLNRLKESGTAEETIDFGAGFLQVDPEPKEILSPLDHREMALIPSGFIESPYYEYSLYLYPFYMDRYPVTNSDYKKFTDAMNMDTPPHWQKGKIPPGMEDHPVVGITYDEALAYAQWVGKDLPLKEEWEIAAGISELLEPRISEKKSESITNAIRKEIITENEVQNKLFSDKKNIKTYPITQMKDNCTTFGICDLLSNVFEYTLSFSSELLVVEKNIILKGFSWLRPSLNLKNDITDGHYSLTWHRWADVGFRCVKRIFCKEEAQRFMADGDKAKDWESQWWYGRAQHVFDTLSYIFYHGPVKPLIAKGIRCCQNLLRLSPGHKKAVYLLTRFAFHRNELSGVKDFFDSTIYPLLAKEKEAADFNWNRLRDILSSLPAREEEEGPGTSTDPVTRQQNLEELTTKIDHLLVALEEDMIIAGLKLTGRTTVESLEYLLNRYEEKFSFLQYTVILFLCLIKMKINKEKETLAARAEITIELLTPTLEMGKESIAAIKVSNRGLAPVEDISIELSDKKPPQKYNGKHLEIARRQFTIPHLVSSETLNLETVVTGHKTGTFSLYMTVGYTNPAAPEGKRESRQTFTTSLKITAPQPVTADAAETTGVRGTAVQDFSLINPYYTGRPIQESDMYFGREDVLERIEKRLGPNNIIILFGQRRTGKTSTLFQLKNRVYRQTAVPVILDIQAMMGDDTSFLFFRMAADLYETMVRSDIAIPAHLAEPVLEDYKNKPQYKYELFLKKAVKVVKEKPIIYLVDEFDGLFYMIKKKQVEPTVLDNLRSIMQHYQQVWFILAGTHLIKSEAADSRSALFNIATYEKIGALEEKDARALITQPLQGKVEYEPYAVDKIISLTNCNPYFIQAICFEIVYYLEEHGLRRVTVKELQEVVDKLFRQGSSHFDQFWTYLSKPESLLLTLLAENIREYENSISLDRVREICKGKIDPKVDIYNVITQLQEKDFLVRREYLGKPHVGFFMELFKRWILIHHPLESYELSGGTKE